MAFLEREKHRPFEWTAHPLLRVYVHLLADKQWQITFSFHHAIVDGWSESTFFTNFLICYQGLLEGNAPEEERLPVRYRDFIALEQATLTSLESPAFWDQALDGHSPTPDPALAG